MEQIKAQSSRYDSAIARWSRLPSYRADWQEQLFFGVEKTKSLRLFKRYFSTHKLFCGVFATDLETKWQNFGVIVASAGQDDYSP